ncbi:MAG: hypothetical protein QNJ54_06215, partial [Prochloraceae cyanobacterium]|nr:hypothetical protein [Prochloraceae cyanobacterium]
PAANSNISAGDRLSGVANGTGSNIASLTYSINNGTAIPLTTTATGTFNSQLDINQLTTGVNSLSLTAIDIAGNRLSTNLNVNLPPTTPTGLSAIDLNEVKFTPTDTQATLDAKGAAKVTFGSTSIYIGIQQVSANNQNPIITSFTNGRRDWVKNDYETGGPDGRGVGLLWDGGSQLYAAFTVDGGGSGLESLARNGWLSSYGRGGGPKVTVVAKLDPNTGGQGTAIAPSGTGTFVSAILNSGRTNTATPTGLSFSNNNLVLETRSAFGPRGIDTNRMQQTTPGISSPFNYTIAFIPNLSRAVSAVAPGWNGTPV